MFLPTLWYYFLSASLLTKVNAFVDFSSEQSRYIAHFLVLNKRPSTDGIADLIRFDGIISSHLLIINYRVEATMRYCKSEGIPNRWNGKHEDSSRYAMPFFVCECATEIINSAIFLETLTDF